MAQSSIYDAPVNSYDSFVSDYDVIFFIKNLLIVANAMTDVEGVVDEIVVGESDALGVARCARGELNKD